MLWFALFSFDRACLAEFSCWFKRRIRRRVSVAAADYATADYA
jgi:hypothetical protein